MRALILVLACLAVVAARGGPAANDLCSDCTLAVRALKDMMCDPGIEGTMVDWVIENVCAAAGDNKQPCTDIVAGVAPALFDWLRLGTDAQEMCAEVGVCGAPPALFAPKPRLPRVRSPANDAACPLCVFVVSKVKEGLEDPATREAVHDASRKACGLMPEGGLRDTCNTWAEQYEETLFSLVDRMEAQDLCAAIGSCSLAERLAAVRPPPLPRGAVAALAPLGHRLAALQGAGARAGGPANDNCEACKVVVAQMHSALANPELQATIVDYAKAVCSSMGGFADACKEHVEEYAPMAFGMILTYLQPDSVCRQLHMCPPPSFAAQMLASLRGVLLPERVGGALLARGVALQAPGDVLRLPVA